MLESSRPRNLHSKDRFIHLVILIMSLVAWPSFSLSTESGQEALIFSILPPEQSLVQNSVRSIIQDHCGFLWIGTLGGLHRFDGQDMDLRGVNPSDRQGVAIRNNHSYRTAWAYTQTFMVNPPVQRASVSSLLA